MNTQLAGPKHARADVGRAHRGRSLLAAAAASLVALTGLSGIALASDEDETTTPSTSASSPQTGATEGALSDETQPAGDAGTVAGSSAAPEVPATVDALTATADPEVPGAPQSEATSPSKAAASVQARDVQIQPYASATSTDIVVRKRTFASPSSVSGTVTTNIGANYANTDGTVFRLYTNVSNAPGLATSYMCTIVSGGECTINVPDTNSGATNNKKRFWVVEDMAAAGTYSNPRLLVGSVSGPTHARYVAGLTKALTPNSTQYLPMTALRVTGGTVIDTSDLPSGASEAQGGSFGAAANSLNNPAIVPKCGVDQTKIALVLDESNSITPTQWTTYRNAIVDPGGLLDVLSSTNAAVSVLGFSDSHTWHYGQSAPGAVNGNQAAIANSIPKRSPGGGTNWDNALSTIASSSTTYDLVLFITDGAPNYVLDGSSNNGRPSGIDVTLRSLEAAIYASNDIKHKGTRVAAVGVGAGITGAGVNLRSVSGTTLNSDYFQTADWNQLKAQLRDIAQAATCQVPITVSKTTVNGTTTIQHAADWQFGASSSGQGTLDGASPQTTASGVDGDAHWSLKFGALGQVAAVELSETPQAGWRLTGVSCTVDGTPYETVISGSSVTISNLSPTSGSVNCVFTNTKVQVGTLAITKAFDSSVPDGAGTSVDFNGSYTCTLGVDTVASGTWTSTGPGAATLTPATGSPAVNQIPVGASCSATETQPTGSGGLPNSSWEWDTYMVTQTETIASNQISTITVTNRAKRVYGNFQVKKVLAAESTADTSKTYTGSWSCALDSEPPVTGAWGPITAGTTWSSRNADKIPLGANCSVTSETRPPFPVAGDHSYQWDGEPSFSVPVISQEGDDLDTVTVTNTTRRLLGSVTWKKVDQTGNLLAGSEWTLKGTGLNTGGVSIMDCTSSPCSDGDFEDQDPAVGEFKLTGLSWGTYSLTEATPPVGYVRDTGSHDFTIDAERLVVTLDPITNVQATPPSLPLTGGLGTDTFLLAGGGLLALAGIGGWIHRRRSQRLRMA